VYCSAAEALPLLQCEAPCALVHVVKLEAGGFDNNEQTVLDLAVALPAHRGKIKVLLVFFAPLQNVAVAGALMRSVAEASVSDVYFGGCDLAPASLPSLTRLLQAGCLERLGISNYGCALFEESPGITAFCHALRSSTLQALTLHSCELWRDPAAAGELMAALVGQQTLQELSLSDRVDGTDDARRAVGEQLAPLITHSSALQKLDLSRNRLGEAGLGPIFEALPHSSTLKELLCSVIDGGGISSEFVRDVILPAVRANTSLRTLDFHVDEDPLPELLEAQAIVDARTHPDSDDEGEGEGEDEDAYE